MTARRSGNARYYRVEPGSPLHAPLTDLIERAIGRAACLVGAIEAVHGLDLAFLSERAPDPGGNHAIGQVGTGEPTRSAASPPCLVLVGDIPLDALDGAVARVERVLGLPPGALEVAFFQPDDWHARIASHNPYAVGLLAGRSLDLLPPSDSRETTLAPGDRR